jgi:hypothetical protein
VFVSIAIVHIRRHAFEKTVCLIANDETKALDLSPDHFDKAHISNAKVGDPTIESNRKALDIDIPGTQIIARFAQKLGKYHTDTRQTSEKMHCECHGFFRQSSQVNHRLGDGEITN